MERGFLTSGPWRQKVIDLLPLGLLVVLPMHPASANPLQDLSWKIDQSIGFTQSQWREHTALGIVHVRENGTLTAASSSVTASHPFMDVTLRYTQLAGNRRYDGTTTQGQAALSSSRVDSSAFSLQAQKSVNSNWSLGLAVDQLSMHRDIQSTPLAQGYPEHFRYTVGKIGAQHRLAIQPEVNLFTSVWLGYALDRDLDLRLPGFDAARLRLGHGKSAEIGWRLVKSFPESGWQVAVRVSYELHQFKAGEAATLFKSGRIAGSAHQPAWRHALTSLNAEASYRF